MLENGNVDGIMEEMFAGFEFLKRKSDASLLIAHLFEEKHGYGVAMNTDDFGWQVSHCLEKVIEFLADEVFSNVSRLLKSDRVSFFLLIG